MLGRLMMDVVPCDHIAPAAGGGAPNGEDEPLVKGPLQHLQDGLALGGVWQVCCP